MPAADQKGLQGSPFFMPVAVPALDAVAKAYEAKDFA